MKRTREMETSMAASAAKRTFFAASAMFLILLQACSLQTSGGGTAQGVQLVSPVEGAQFVVGETVPVISTFNDPGGAKGMVLEANGVAVRTDQFFSPMPQGRMDQPWRPAADGAATLCVYLSTSDGKQLRSNCVRVQVGPAASTTPAVTDAAATQASPTPTHTPTATLGAPRVTATQDANCRAGPGLAYEVQGNLLLNESAPIFGRNLDSTWWVIRIIGIGDCWIWNGTVTVSGDTGQVTVITPPAPPVGAPEPISPSGTLACADVTGGVTLEWTEVEHPNGIDHYEWVLEGGVDRSGSTAATQAEVNMINCGDDYQWRVLAVDGQGNESAWSESMQFDVP
jgi:hypothetical protein